MKRFFTNWKTGLAGSIMLVTSILPYTGLINEKQANAVITIAGAFGLIKAKDDNVTGGTKVDPKDTSGVTVAPK